MLNSTALRRQCKSAARLEIQRGGLWKCIGAIALMAIPETLLSVAVNIKMNPAMELLNQMALDETIDLSQYMEQVVTVYAYLGIFVLVSLLILSPLQFGALHFCMARAHGQQGEMGDVVIGFSRLKKISDCDQNRSVHCAVHPFVGRSADRRRDGAEHCDCRAGIPHHAESECIYGYDAAHVCTDYRGSHLCVCPRDALQRGVYFAD